MRIKWLDTGSTTFPQSSDAVNWQVIRFISASYHSDSFYRLDVLPNDESRMREGRDHKNLFAGIQSVTG